MTEIKVPEFGESIIEGTISQWLKQEGEFVSNGEVIVEIETEKVNAEIPAEYNGIVKKTLKQAGETVKVGEVIALFEQQDAAMAEQAKTNAAASDKLEDHASSSSPESTASVLATPAARKIARERGIDLHQLQRTDPLGRIQKHDIAEQHKQNEQQAQVNTNELQTAEKPVERIRMSRRRQTIARNLVQAQQTAAMLTTFNEIDMSAIMEARNRHKLAFEEKYQIKLGFMSFFIKAVIAALKEYPFLNAEIAEDEFIIKKHYDIGVAVSTDEGLVVPVIKGADQLSFAEIEREIAELANKARNKKLTLDHLRGGTFTITNGGVFGSLLSTPILNAPQVGILGMHTIQKRPVAVDDDRMENRPMMYIALSYDHRIVDGREAVGFLVKTKQLLEDPLALMLDS